MNIKLHQYQCWKSGGLRVLRGYRETVLVAKGKQTLSLQGRQLTKSPNREITPFPSKFYTQKIWCSYGSAMFLQTKASWKCFDEARSWTKAGKAILVTKAHPSMLVCWLVWGGLSVLNPTCNWGRHTGKSCNSTAPTLQPYRQITISIFHSKSIFNGPLGPVYWWEFIKQSDVTFCTTCRWFLVFIILKKQFTQKWKCRLLAAQDNGKSSF